MRSIEKNRLRGIAGGPTPVLCFIIALTARQTSTASGISRAGYRGTIEIVLASLAAGASLAPLVHRGRTLGPPRQFP